MKKKHYIKPGIVKVVLDNTISLIMDSLTPPGGSGFEPRGDGTKSSPKSDPFASPFSDKPFK
jgi:hypothetical protein